MTVMKPPPALLGVVVDPPDDPALETQGFLSADRLSGTRSCPALGPRMALSTCVGGNFRVRCQKASSLLSACVSPASWCCSEALDCTSLRPVTLAEIYGLQSPKFTRPAGLTDAPSALHCTTTCCAAPNFRPQLKLQRQLRRNRERCTTIIIIIIITCSHQRAAVTFT